MSTAFIELSTHSAPSSPARKLCCDEVSPFDNMPSPAESPLHCVEHSTTHSALDTTFSDDCGCSCSSSVSYRTTPGFSNPARPFEGVTVVFVRPSSTARIPIYTRLRSLGLRIMMVSREHRPAYDIGVDRWVLCEPNDPDSITAALAETAKLEIADGYSGEFSHIVTFDEYGIFPAAVLNERAGRRPMPFSSGFIDLNNVKTRFRDWCVEHGVRAPRYCSMRRPDECPFEAMEAAGVTLPIVIKPCPGAGSSFVRMCRTREEVLESVPMLWAGIERMAKNDVYFAGGLSQPPHLLMEEFIGGQEVDIDCVVENGVLRFAGISDNFATVPPWFSEMGGVAPSQLPSDAQDSLLELLNSYLAAARRCGERCHGVLHFEAKFDPERNAAFVIEVNCRLGGAETQTMVRTAFGVDLGEAAMRLALELPLQAMPPLFSTTGVVAASVNVYPQRVGHLVDIREPSLDDPSLVASVPFPVAKGSLIGPPPVCFGCFLWVVAKGRDAKEAIANIQRLTAQCEIVVSEPTA